MRHLSYHNSLLTLPFGLTFVVFTLAVYGQTQALPHDTAICSLETVAAFDCPMPTVVYPDATVLARAEVSRPHAI